MSAAEMRTNMFAFRKHLARVAIPANTKGTRNGVPFVLAGIVGLEPTHAGVKVLCLNRLGYIPLSLYIVAYKNKIVNAKRQFCFSSFAFSPHLPVNRQQRVSFSLTRCA